MFRVSQQHTEYNYAEEQRLRQKLATLYHLIDHNGWGDSILSHCSVRLPDNSGFLFNHFGMNFNEITPENLVKVDFYGKIISYGDKVINNNGAKAHSAIYKARPDVNCVIHTHTTNGIVFSALNEPLKIYDQVSTVLHNDVGYHPFEQLFQADEHDTVAQNLGKNASLVLHNHGLISTGPSVERAFWNYRCLEKACEIHVELHKIGKQFQPLSDTICAHTKKSYEKYHETQPSGQPGLADMAFAAATRLVEKKVGESSLPRPRI